MGAQRILPNTTDRETRGFFEAAAEGRLVFRACTNCDHGIHPPTEYCHHCGSWATEWREAKGTGRLHAWTTVTHQIHEAFPVPYTVVVVELDDTPDVRLIGSFDGEPQLEVGMPMEVWFETLAEGVVLPQWRPAESAN